VITVIIVIIVVFHVVVFHVVVFHVVVFHVVVFHVVVFHVVVFHVVVFHVVVLYVSNNTGSMSPPSYELPACYQAPFSRMVIFGRFRRLWIVRVVSLLKSRSVVFNLCPSRCVVDAYISNVELLRSVWAVKVLLVRLTSSSDTHIYCYAPS
jgi:hypothetical protein